MIVADPKVDSMIESISSVVYASGVDSSPESRVVQYCMSEGGGDIGMLKLSHSLICFKILISGANSARVFVSSTYII